MLTKPRRRASTSSFCRSGTATPPWNFSARTVATTTTASGRSPDLRHLMSMNFSAPRSDPKPASVTTMSASLSAVRVAITELQPWAMLANGTAVHEDRRVLERLHEVGRQRVLEQDGEGALGAEVGGRDRLLGAVVGDDDAADAALEVRQRLGQAEDRHQLRRHDDVEAVLARDSRWPCRPDRRRSGAGRGR